MLYYVQTERGSPSLDLTVEKKKSKNHSHLCGSIGNDIGASPTPGQHMHNVNDLSIEHYVYEELPNDLPVEDNNDELPVRS